MIGNRHNVNKKIKQVAKDHNNETARDRKTVKYYDEMDAVLGHRPAS